MKIRVLAKRRNPTAKRYHIYIALYANNQTQIISTGQTLSVSEWSETEGMPKDHKGEAFKAITKIKGQLIKIIQRMDSDDLLVTPIALKEAYKDFLSQKESGQLSDDKITQSGKQTLSRLANNYIENHLFKFRKSTQTVVKSSINRFLEFLKHEKIGGLEKKYLSNEVITAYDRYLIGKKISDNTHGKLMKHLRWFLKSIDFDVSKIKIRSYKKTKIALSIDELKKLEAVDVSFSLEMQKAKDLFLLGCYTGLRISDLKRLNPVNTKDGFISIKLLKNNRDVKIPIIHNCNRILAAYKFKAPRLASHTLNEQIKLVCDKAGIKELTTVDYTQGGQRLSKTIPKHKLISSHVASKTFITLAPERWGLSPAEIADIVGKDLRTLLSSYFGDKSEEGRKKMIQMDRAQMSVSKLAN